MILALKHLAAAATFTETNGKNFSFLSTAFNTFTYFINKHKYKRLFLKKKNIINVLIFHWILCFFCWTFANRLAVMFLFTKLMKGHCCYVLVLICWSWSCSEPINYWIKLIDIYCKTNRKVLCRHLKLFGTWIIFDGREAVLQLQSFLSGRVKNSHCVFLVTGQSQTAAE